MLHTVRLVVLGTYLQVTLTWHILIYTCICVSLSLCLQIETPVRVFEIRGGRIIYYNTLYVCCSCIVWATKASLCFVSGTVVSVFNTK